MTHPRTQASPRVSVARSVQYTAESRRVAYWQQPGLVERIEKALADHKAGKSIPFRAEDAG